MTESQIHMLELAVMPVGFFFGGGGDFLNKIFLWVLGLHIQYFSMEISK
jgi:hypothetical protein